MSRDDDKTWAELVDSFHSSPSASDAEAHWPAAENLDPDDERDDYGDASVTLGTLSTGQLQPGASRLDDADDAAPVAGSEHAGAEESNHFVPPTPAPIPRGDRVSRLAWAGVITGPAALILMAVFSWTPPDEVLVFIVTAFIAGFVTLIARLRGHHPNDPDNGAVL